MPHPRISVNSLSSVTQSFGDDIAMWRELGVDHVGVITTKAAATGWDETARLVSDAGLRVSNIASETPADILGNSIELAAAVGAGVTYICSGPMGAGTWDEQAQDFCARLAPLVSRATELGVAIGLEPTNPLRTDVSFVFSVRDALDLAREAGLKVVVDLYSCWYERDLGELIRKNVDMISLVQICDYTLGTFDTPNRAVIGDGDIPIERLLGVIVDAGYEGVFDLEILGPEIERQGYRSVIARSLDAATGILERVGA